MYWYNEFCPIGLKAKRDFFEQNFCVHEKKNN